MFKYSKKINVQFFRPYEQGKTANIAEFFINPIVNRYFNFEDYLFT